MIRKRNNNNNRNVKRTKLSVSIPRLPLPLVLRIFTMARQERQRRINNMRNRVQNYRRSHPLWNHRTIAMHVANNTNHQYTYQELMRYMRSRQFRFVNNI